MLRLGLLSLAISCFCGGCGSDRRSEPHPDAGPDRSLDASARDAAPASDAGLDAGASDAGPSCREEIVPPYVGPIPCSMATRSCVDACADGDCLFRCLEADPSAPCQDCLDRATVTCVNRNGCQPQWNCFRQCIVDNCPVPTDACITMNCTEPENAWNTCAGGEPLRVCGTAYEECLPP